MLNRRFRDLPEILSKYEEAFRFPGIVTFDSSFMRDLSVIGPVLQNDCSLQQGFSYVNKELDLLSYLIDRIESKENFGLSEEIIEEYSQVTDILERMRKNTMRRGRKIASRSRQVSTSLTSYLDLHPKNMEKLIRWREGLVRATRPLESFIPEELERMTDICQDVIFDVSEEVIRLKKLSNNYKSPVTETNLGNDEKLYAKALMASYSAPVHLFTSDHGFISIHKIATREPWRFLDAGISEMPAHGVFLHYFRHKDFVKEVFIPRKFSSQFDYSR